MIYLEFDKLTEKINIAIKKMDIFVDNISYKKKGKYNFLEITLDKVGGIDLDEIVDATKIINPIVEENFKKSESYVLDVYGKENDYE